MAFVLNLDELVQSFLLPNRLCQYPLTQKRELQIVLVHERFLWKRKEFSIQEHAPLNI